MLVLTIDLGKFVQIGDDISFKVVSTSGSQAEFLFCAPTTTIIIREELKETPAPLQPRSGKGMGLTLNRRMGEAVLIGENIRVVFLKIVTRQKVSVGFEAPREIQIHRKARVVADHR